MSPWRGRSPAGWQFRTTRVRKHLAKFREYRRRPGRRIAYRGEALGRREAGRWSETAFVVGAPASRATSATRTLIRISSPHPTSPAIAGGGQLPRCSRASFARPVRIAVWIGQNHVAHGLVIFDVAGATAQVSVERLGDGLLEVGPRHWIARQTREQHLAFVQKTRGTLAALEGKMRR